MSVCSQADWSFFYGGYRLDGNVTEESPRGFIEIPGSVGVGTTHFLGVRSAAIPALVAYLEAQLQRSAGHPEGGPMHVDGSYTWFRRAHPEHRTFWPLPNSDISAPPRPTSMI